MKPVQKFCLACTIGLLAASDDTAALDLGTVVAATTDVSPMYSPAGTQGRPQATSARALPKDDPGGMATSAPSAESTAKLSDGAITTRVKAELLTARGGKSTGIQVSTENGVVHLVGKVQSDSEKLTILNTTRAVEGVQSVMDGLQVGK
jgi:hyperosmotically inducible protein